MIFNVFSLVFGVAVLLSDKIYSLFNRCFIPEGSFVVAHKLEFAPLVFCVLHTVVAYNVSREAAELIVNTHASACADHQELIFFHQLFKNAAVLTVKLSFMLRERAVEIKCESFYHCLKFSFFIIRMDILDS